MATTSHAQIIEHVPFHADPILAAIDYHDEAWSVWQCASDALVAQRHVEMEGTWARLPATPCATQFGALALLRHLRGTFSTTASQMLRRSAQPRIWRCICAWTSYPSEPARVPLAPALRLLSSLGEAVAALFLICSGLVVIGLATLA